MVYMYLSLFINFFFIILWVIEKLNGGEEEGEVNEEDSKSTEKFEWEEVITAVLEKKGEMPIKKLRKKVSRFKKKMQGCATLAIHITFF